MNEPTVEDVERIVRAVLAELGHAPGSGGAREAVFAGRLFSLRHAESLIDGESEVRLAPGAVVTPLARDLLKRRGVAVRYVSEGEADRPGAEGEWGFAIESSAGFVQAVRRALLAGPPSWREVGNGAAEAARWVAGSDRRGAVLLTDEASVAAWRANGLGVRAATVCDAPAVERAVRRLGVNLLVVEPAGQSIHHVRQLCATFRRGGAPALPPELRRADGHEDRRGDRPGDAVSPAPQPAERPLHHHPAHAGRGLDGGLARAW